jgi:hypothetical protein
MPEQTLKQRVVSLESANDLVTSVFDHAFFLHSVIMNPRGTQLHALMMTISRLLTDPVHGRIAKYRATCADGVCDEALA